MKGKIPHMDGNGDRLGSAAEERTYRIGELAALFGVTGRTIRYYEELGLLDASEREGGEHRRYDERNAVYLKRIQQL
ncbi:MAG: MerR family transcriptional regulator, partial [Spirochaetaceae bacterium]|nr:MerR family transcriptional regulator [Spirochaetaceae bacterium]